MRKNKKRYLKSIGTLSVMAIPAIAVVSCSNGNSKIENAAKTGADKAVKKHFTTTGTGQNNDPAVSPIITNTTPVITTSTTPAKTNTNLTNDLANLKDGYNYLKNVFAKDFKNLILSQKQLSVFGSTDPIVTTIYNKETGWKNKISHQNQKFVDFVKSAIKNGNAINAIFNSNKITLETDIDSSNKLKFTFQMSGSPDINISIDLDVYN